MLAAIVLVAQVATTTPNPCADQLAALCRISPLFCPTAYPSNMVPGTNGIPCWPDRQVDPVSRGSSPQPTRDVRPRGTPGEQPAAAALRAPDPSTRPVTQRSFFSALSKLLRLSAD